MVYGAEVRDNMGCCWQTGELKTKNGVIKRLERAGIVKQVWNGNGWNLEPLDGNQFVLYCRTEWKNQYDKSAYNTLEGNMLGSWKF